MKLHDILILNQLDFFILFIFLICLGVATAIISKLNTSEHVYESLQRNSTIDGLRGFLALGVFCHHYYITYFWKTTGVWQRPNSELLNNFGSVSVSFFFLITGYLFLNKISKQNVNWMQLFKSRIRRIVPLYAFVSVIIMFITLCSITSQYTTIDILKWVFSWAVFLGKDLKDFSTGRIIAGVNWSLIYEWIFYFSLPLIYIFIHPKSKYNKFILLLIPLFIFIIYKSPLKMVYLLFLFSYPAIIFKQNIINLIARYKILFDVLILILLIYVMLFTSEYTLVQEILLSIIFCFIVNGCDFFGVLKIKGLKLLGDVSYSTYLLHGLIIYTIFTLLEVYDFSKGPNQYFLYFPFIFALVIFLSFLSYRYIEKPFIHNSSRLKS